MLTCHVAGQEWGVDNPCCTPDGAPVSIVEFKQELQGNFPFLICHCFAHRTAMKNEKWNQANATQQRPVHLLKPMHTLV
jgi:hypothetical protein